MAHLYDTHEITNYFAEFLASIAQLISSVKQHAYDLVELPLLSKPSLIHYHHLNISQLVAASYHTYEDLRKVSAILAGVLRSKNDIFLQNMPHHHPTTPRPLSRSKTVANTHKNLFYSPLSKMKIPLAKMQLFGESDEKTISPKTIIKQVNYQDKTEIKEQAQFSDSSEDQTMKILSQAMKTRQTNDFDQKTIKGKKDLCENKQFKPSCQRNSRATTSKTIHTPQLCGKTDNNNLNIEERINNFFKNSRQSMNSIIDTNRECLLIVKSVKKDLKACSPQHIR